MPDIDIEIPTLFTQPGCVQCRAVKRKLDEQGIKYQVVDASEVPEALSLLKDEWGYSSVPVTYFRGKHFNGFNPYEISALIEDYRSAEAA